VLSEVDTSDVSQVDVETYQSEATGGLSSILVYNLLNGVLIAYSDRAVLFGLHRQDASTEHLLATSSFTYDSTGVRT
jgi:hypothetical protein